MFDITKETGVYIMLMNVFEGILIPFVETTLGAACVFFMRKTLSKLLQRALALSLGIAIQNFPEGAIISMRVKVRERHFWEVYFQELLNRLEQ